MRIVRLAAGAVLIGLAACGAPSGDPPTKAEDAPAEGVVPAAFVGVWSGDGCDNPAIRIGERDIRHFYMTSPAALTSVETPADGRLVVVWSDDGVATTETFQLTDGRLDHVATSTPTESDDWISDPMTRCPAGTPMS